MNFFTRKKLNSDPYNIYLKRIAGIYFDPNPGVQITYVISGSINYSIEDNNYTVEEGELLVANIFENRFIYSQDPDNLCLILTIDREVFEELGIFYLNGKLKNYIPKEQIDLSIINRIFGLYKISQDKLDLDSRVNELHRIIFKMDERYINMRTSVAGVEEKARYIIAIEDIVLNQQLELLNLKYLADKLHVTPAYISRVFNELTGSKFVDFAQQIKLYCASNYLLKTSHTVEDIASFVGFGATKSLNRVFNKFLGLKPLSYKKNFKIINDNLESNPKFQEILINSIKPDFTRFVKSLYQKDKLNFDIDLEAEARDYKENWALIRDIKSLGKDYKSSFKKVVRNLKIDEIVLRFNYDYKNKEIILADTGEEISQNNIDFILESCLDHNIHVVLSFRPGKINLSKKNDQENKLNAFKDFYTMIANSMGTSNMINFSYFIDMTGIVDHADNDENLSIYKDYINSQQNFLASKIGNYDFSWGMEFGHMNKDKFQALKKTYEKLYHNSKFVPSFISFTCDCPEIKEINSPEQIEDIYKFIDDLLDQLLKIKKEVNFPANKLYVRGLYREVDMKNISPQYREMFLALLMAQSMSLNSKGLLFLTDLKFKALDKKEDYYSPDIIGKYNCYTPVYWALFLMGQIKGSIIYSDRGVLVTKYIDDLYILIYGNTLADLLYAKQNNFIGLADSKLDLDLNIKNLRGKYKITSQIVSFEHGSILSNIGDYDNYLYLNSKERDYIKELSIPSFNIEVKDINEDFTDSISYYPFNLILKKYIKV